MGDKTRKFAEGMSEKDLFETILRENIFYSPKRILQLFDDDDPEVLAIFLSIRKRLEGEALEEGKGGKVERLLGVFNAACRRAGIVIEPETMKEEKPKGDNLFGEGDLQGLMDGFAQIGSNGTMKPGSSGPGRITTEIQSTRGLRNSMRGNIVLAAPMFRNAVESGAKTLEVGCPGFRDFPKSIARGGYVMFSFNDKKPPIKVEVIRVNKYKSIDELVDGEGDELKKLVMGTEKEEIQTNLGRIFMEHRVRENGLVVFEFRQVD